MDDSFMAMNAGRVFRCSCGRAIDVPAKPPIQSLQQGAELVLDQVTDGGRTPLFLVKYLFLVPGMIAACSSLSLFLLIKMAYDAWANSRPLDVTLYATLLLMVVIGHAITLAAIAMARGASPRSTLIGLSSGAWRLILIGSYLAGAGLGLWILFTWKTY